MHISQRKLKRISKSGQPVWIQASYNPVFADDGKLYKVIKFAIDITEQKLKDADFQSQIEAIGKSQAVIKKALSGNRLIRVAKPPTGPKSV